MATTGGGGGGGDAPGLRDEGRALFGRQSAGAGRAGSGDAAAAGGGWTIILAAFRGETRGAEAAAALDEARRLGLNGAVVEARGSNAVLAYGSFDDATSPQAQAELDRVRGLMSGGAMPFGGAFLAPPYSVEMGSRPEYNLLRAKSVHGERALYSLQIGVYSREDVARPSEADLREMRKAAEEAVVTLRREGELAFYYHGPNRSMVTVGIFDHTDFDPQTPSYQSRRLQELRKRFPHNLYNGQAYRVRRGGSGPARIQPSGLINIPEQ